MHGLANKESTLLPNNGPGHVESLHCNQLGTVHLRQPRKFLLQACSSYMGPDPADTDLVPVCASNYMDEKNRYSGLGFRVRPSPSFTACRTQMPGLSHQPESLTTFLMFSGSSTGYQCPSAFFQDLDIDLLILTLILTDCMACHQITSETY